jgi:hypothetical protein
MIAKGFIPGLGAKAFAIMEAHAYRDTDVAVETGEATRRRWHASRPRIIQ